MGLWLAPYRPGVFARVSAKRLPLPKVSVYATLIHWERGWGNGVSLARAT